MVLAGDIMRLIFPIGSEDHPEEMSMVVGDIALILMVEEIHPDPMLPWEPPPKIYCFSGETLVKGKIESGKKYAIKISEQPDKYF